MNRASGTALALAASGAVIAPFLLKPFGIYLISMWAVLTIAAIGLNLTLGYAGQVSMAQGAFVGIGAYTLALLTQAGVPYPLAFVAAGIGKDLRQAVGRHAEPDAPPLEAAARLFERRRAGVACRRDRD